MKKMLLVVATIFATQSSSQELFKEERVIHGITYLATFNTPTKAVYVQQDYFDFTLAADSFYVQVMTDLEWDAFRTYLMVEEDAFFRNGLYHLPDNRQVFNTGKKDDFFDGTYIYQLFGSVDTSQ